MQIIRFAALILMCGAAAGCATLHHRDGDGTAEAWVTCAPSDLSISEGGSAISLESSSMEISRYKDASTRTVSTYDRPVVKLAYDRPHTLTLSANGQTKTVTVEPQRQNAWIWANLFTSGPIGLLIDSHSGAWNQFNVLDAGYPFTNTHCSTKFSN